MAKSPKKPAPKKGGAKKCSPKKAPARRKPIPQQVVEESAAQRAARVKAAFDGPAAPSDYDVRQFNARYPRQTVEEQNESLLGGPGVLLAKTTFTPELPAPAPTGPKSKFWRQYQDETGKFIGWRKALTKTKDQVISRLRLRKKPA